jgi:hypothetical protein
MTRWAPIQNQIGLVKSLLTKTKGNVKKQVGATMMMDFKSPIPSQSPP